MKRALIVLPAISLLCACGSADGELTAGKWKNTMSVSKFEIPGAPPAMAERVKAMMSQTQSSEACMSAAQAKMGVRDFSGTMQQGDCKMEDFQQGGGKMSGKLVCTSGPMGATTMQMTGTYDKEKVAMTLGGDIKQAQLPGGKATIEMSIKSERVGDCTT